MTVVRQGFEMLGAGSRSRGGFFGGEGCGEGFGGCVGRMVKG